MKEVISKCNLGTKNTEKRLSKTRDMQIRNLDRITKLALQKLNKEMKNVKEGKD